VIQTPAAVQRLHVLSNGPKPRLIRIGVRNKGCAGMAYHLEYVDQPAKFDEVVNQDGVKVLIDSKALFSIIGSEMDWAEDRIRSAILQLTTFLSSCFLSVCAVPASHSKTQISKTHAAAANHLRPDSDSGGMLALRPRLQTDLNSSQRQNQHCYVSPVDILIPDSPH
jgi:iron-sulfur cluster assembly accessory protein